VRTKTAALKQTEWDFAWAKKLTWNELKCCSDYEFGREIQTLRDGVLQWREKVQANSFKGLHDISWKIGCLGFVRICCSFPEWPREPVGSIDPKTLSERVKQLGYQAPISEWDLKEKQNTEALAGIIDPEWAYWDTPASLILLRIPENCTHEELRNCFAAYLKTNFPQQAKRGGQSRPVSKWRADLKALGAYRLLKVMTADEAGNYTQDLCGKALYENESQWSTARTRTERLILEYEKDANEVIERQKRLRDVFHGTLHI
jgi:hypothetical protein